MSEPTFLTVFLVVWFCAMAYGLSAFRLLLRVRDLKRAGGGGDAPDPLTNPLDIFGYLGWLLTGRYSELEDPVVTRWAGIARILFIVALPMILALFAFVFTQADVFPA
jgi:hypothetical protein